LRAIYAEGGGGSARAALRMSASVSRRDNTDRRVHLHESHRTLRDGSLGVAHLCQALRARLGSYRPSGTFRNSLVQLFLDTVTPLAKIPVKRQAPRSLTEYVTTIQNVSI
jgi:hypothetical protein